MEQVESQVLKLSPADTIHSCFSAPPDGLDLTGLAQEIWDHIPETEQALLNTSKYQADSYEGRLRWAVKDQERATMLTIRFRTPIRSWVHIQEPEDEGVISACSGCCECCAGIFTCISACFSFVSTCCVGMVRCCRCCTKCCT